MIDEAEMKGQKENEKIRKTNIQIKKQNNIRTIESQLEKERCSFALNGKKTKSIAYLYDRNKSEFNIENAIKTLQEIKKTIIEKDENYTNQKMIKDKKKQSSARKSEKTEKNGENMKKAELSDISLHCSDINCINYDVTNVNEISIIMKGENSRESDENDNEDDANEDDHNILLEQIREYLETCEQDVTQDNNKRYNEEDEEIEDLAELLEQEEEKNDGQNAVQDAQVAETSPEGSLPTSILQYDRCGGIGHEPHQPLSQIAATPSGETASDDLALLYRRTGSVTSPVEKKT